MHRLAATPGGWNPQEEGVILVSQTPAPIAIVTAADTDIQAIAQALVHLPPDFPDLRVVNLLQLQQQLSIDAYALEVLCEAQVIVLRLLGGRAYWSYGLEVVRETVQNTGAHLIVIPGDDAGDPDLIGHSSVPLVVVNQVWQYFTEGGVDNLVNALQFVAQICLKREYNPAPPMPIPRVGLYPWKSASLGLSNPPFTREESPLNPSQSVNSKSGLNSGELSTSFPRVGILFYRAHYLAGNTAPIDALCQGLRDRHLDPVPVFVSSLRDQDVQAELLTYLQPPHTETVQIILNTTGFAIGQAVQTLPSTPDFATADLRFWDTLDVPVLQVIFSGGTQQQWETGFQGLSPRDMAMNVALPEVDGRIITRVVSFKTVQENHVKLETPVVMYEPLGDRINFVTDLAANWIKLRQTPPSQRKIALILANYPTRDGRLANGVGLDTPASCIAILNALQNAGYCVENIPTTGDELIRLLTAGVTNDPEGEGWRKIRQVLPGKDYQSYFQTLPQPVRQGIENRWGKTPGDRPFFETQTFPIPGIQLGNIFIGIQPSRGYEIDPSLNYHAPDLEPTHEYLAYYYWIRECFGAQAITHVGKHGNLEWLPGKSIALSENCFPEVALGPMPHFYPFIVNDPGEGSQAKRRSQAVIIDHLTPPMTRAELYGPLQQLEGLIDEYYEAQSLDPVRLKPIRSRLLQLVKDQHLDKNSSWTPSSNSTEPDPEFTALIANLDGYLCELKEAQIRDGLHIFGKCPEGRQLVDLIVAIARHPGGSRMGLTRALAADQAFSFDPLTSNPAEFLPELTANSSRRTIGDAIASLEAEAAALVSQIIDPMGETILPKPNSATAKELDWIRDCLLPALQRTSEEITQLLRGLDGRYIKSGPSGAPTRGRPEVLPTGRNFYSVDIRAIPTETAWDIGRRAAEEAIERYTQENGEYPQTLGLSVWGTSTMRTGGDDIAEALALLGVRPVWDGPSRRVVDFEILPVRVLGRPRVDVTLRVSGFFRDAFPNLIDLFDRAVEAVASLEEPATDNPLAAQVQVESETWQGLGLTPEQANRRSRYRVFGSKPGAYGAGLQGLIEGQNWTNDADLARAYINWSSYAYTGMGNGHSAPEAFEQRLGQMQIVLHNQDNREHDLLDSDDYYQFQGGLLAAVRAVRGTDAVAYFGDHSLPEKPKIRRLQEEIDRVYRSRVVNPKWIEGVMRHGYKGAFEMAATLDYLFAYDATAHCVEDFMYEGVAKAYLLDDKVRDFIHQKNPWALRDMAERLLEANQRGLWEGVDQRMLEELRAIVHDAEGAIESAIGS
ncbi:cobaltochelatase subunit CobN [Laspinema olomoucense]|uniref:cobaltochelatase subunit CobN n=1 Tax=Laspinema olomoucense TaxID=3231600 RepID=UPI0021BB473B|nr:cobaltochelatase subunit CobN [Laspinema sp. D3d]MCT7973584.1 cobaltochelatase subunit CobN [Laspinema sp. D3d]